MVRFHESSASIGIGTSRDSVAHAATTDQDILTKISMTNKEVERTKFTLAGQLAQCS